MYTLFSFLFFPYVALFSNFYFPHIRIRIRLLYFPEYSLFNAVISAIVPGVIPPIILSAANNGRTNI